MQLSKIRYFELQNILVTYLNMIQQKLRVNMTNVGRGGTSRIINSYRLKPDNWMLIKVASLMLIKVVRKER